MIITKDNLAIITDIAVQWEGSQDISETYVHKKVKHSEKPFLDSIQKTYHNTNIKVLPLIVGARRGWCSLNNDLIKELNEGEELNRDIILTSIKGGCIIHRNFMKKVWKDQQF